MTMSCGQDCFLDVHTNPAVFRDGALQLSPYHGAHECTTLGGSVCPANMCKGKVGSQLAHAKMWHQVRG